MKVEKFSILLFLILFGNLLLSEITSASVYITPAVGGEAIPSANADKEWIALGPVVIREGMPGDIKGGDIIFVIPDGFELNIQVVPNVSVSNGTELTAHLSSISSNEIRITVNQISVTNPHSLSIGNTTAIQVRPTINSLMNKNIYISTSNIEGVMPGPEGTSFGVLQTILVSPPPESVPEQEPPAEETEPPEKPIWEMTEEELENKIIQVQEQIIILLGQLIQLIQNQINALKK